MMSHDQAVEALATYALDAVEGDERDEIEQHLADCPRCRAELDALREVTTALGNSVEPRPEGLWSSIAGKLSFRDEVEHPPMPPLIRELTADQIAHEMAHLDLDLDLDLDPSAAGADAAIESLRARRDAGASPRSAATRGRLAAVGAVLVAAAAVVTVLGVSLVHANNHVSQLERATAGHGSSAVVSALLAPGHKVVTMKSPDQVRLAQFVVADGRGYLVSSTLPALHRGQTYQLWGIVAGRPISLGLLGPRPAQSTFTLAGSPSASELAITVEPSVGAVVPSLPPVAAGTV